MPPIAVVSLADALETGRVTLNSSSYGFSRLRGVENAQATKIARAFYEVFGASRCELPDVNEESIAFALRVANCLRAEERLGRPEIEIAWTGPESEGPLIRSTSFILEEMLQGVREVGEVLLVGYAFTVEAGTEMERVVELLAEATRRRAGVSIVLHSDATESRNLDNLLRNWDVFVKKPAVYTWRPPANHPYTKLHAKCLVIDRLDALVTSANFTFHGLESNLELGLRVRGPQAAVIAQRFDQLIAAEVLRPWKVEHANS